ncbi:HAD-IB family phosphatase [Kitasatospora sp. NPDC004723]|uniref:HAD family hydrolase n=1 Tax=Kitasatospora sp. NPDC004723 TaxID=3154288 RepID=UPI0033A8A688
MKIALLDMDGTLTPSALGMAMLGSRPAARLIDPVAMKDLGRLYRDSQGSVTSMYALHEKYAQTLAGLPESAIQELAEEVWQSERISIYPHTKPLIDLLHLAGYRTVLVSGSPDEIVRLVARDLGAHAGCGTRLVRSGGQYTGRLEQAPALPGGKRAVLEEVVQPGAVDWNVAYALGNSWPDIEVLNRAGFSLLFEPDPHIREAAEWFGIRQATRRTVLEQTRELLSASLAAAAGDVGRRN